ncbi:nucleoid-associated protein [Streptococcus suis]|uniref:nucleoid-associated protein n=1 Tax=Streptococcus suis TaxID=1307 RepID=UPI000CF4F39A|nr:nucleoid-associated protein [Streptococcus suis]MBY4984959.1 nucleoid-associated protein [Streptococcus suis]MBY5038087.1 nucleoid-associated protein [Streptococcus suis]MCK3882752.1 nucleoid-associated protein [Streptococcus suis]NQN52966.1 nucleoid-associated protein [Streptococcus suis]HEM5984006.1 nucleoid-associated protein [Streptococcus suis]
MDIFVKKAIIHQFSPDDTELVLADQLLTVSPKIEEYLRKKIERVFSDEAKTGQFEADNPFLDFLNEDLLTSSVKIAGLWKEEFSISENLKTNDLIFIEFERNGVEHFAFLRIALRENLAHVGSESDSPLKITQNNLPGAGSAPDEALIVNLQTRKYHLIEKRIKHNGAFLNYFSDNLLQVTPAISAKKSIKAVEQTAQKIADNFHQGDFQFQSKVKSAIFNHLEEDNELSPEKLADQLFDNNLTARLNFVDQIKEVIPDKITFDEIDSSRQLKKFENQKLSLSNGIELIVPNSVYEDAESVEFIQNDNGTYSILIKNIEDIKSK